MNYVVFRAAGRLCAISSSEVEEIMRPLDHHPVAGAPDFVLGVAIVRGEPTPVIDLGFVISGQRTERPTRMISLRIGARRVGAVVDEVTGLWSALPVASSRPPLLADARPAVIERLGLLDGELLSVLEAAEELHPGVT